ncbi:MULTISPECIES: SDR family oxidoreductase [Gammaproteobacteria]|uniref:SDR family oxidoreductase n=1 Tax=Gammaproteobacteria TaxID=1236 RepID=UPI000DD0C709|nr:MULTISPECIES: SDR family oxidoreductase [Gammaproteobacteria]RTE86629.1 SDR family oxidoreductase [Aliidiomarina sp. B3213]TCZ90816.1 SDR family oxidoreductase [Lysobacter sp. N42]
MVQKSSQRVFITGGANGLGLALAKHYASEGATVCIADLDEEAGAKALEQLQAISPSALFTPCDVTQSEDLQRVAQELMDTWGGVDIVFNNAGVAQVGNIEDVSDEDWRWIIDINLMGVVRGCRTFTPMFKKQGHGYFVNVASLAGLLDVPSMSAYNATKASVVSLSETLQHELAPANISVSVVCPSFFQTNLGQGMRSTVPGMQQKLDRLMSKSEINAEDVAKIIAEGIQHNKFYILPHKSSRKFWRMKKWLPRAWYARMMAKGNKKKR